MKVQNVLIQDPVVKISADFILSDSIGNTKFKKSQLNSVNATFTGLPLE